MPNTLGRAFACLLLLPCLGAGPATAPSDPLARGAIEAAGNGTLRPFAASLDAQIRPLLTAAPRPADADQLIRLVSLREFGRYFGRIQTLSSTQTETLQWLAGKPRLLSTLMLAVSEADAPDRVLDVLTMLRIDAGDKLEEFPDLTAAMCVVWDEPARSSREGTVPEPNRPARLMRYYISARQQMRFDLSRLPWQLSVYIVDNRVNEDDLAWALTQYAARGTIGAAYFDVPYDYGAFYGTGMAPDQKEQRAYTLQNLRLFGGICADQAYYATQVARTIGVPATTAAGRGNAAGGEVAHAWVGYLDTRGNQVFWNFEEGRYPEYQFWKGRIVDPQTREPVTEADVSLLAELDEIPERNRLLSAALCKAADLRESSERAALYMQAVNHSPGNRSAWLALAELGAQLKLSDRQYADLKAVTARFAARQYPDFAFEILSRAISGRGTAQQLAELEQMKQTFDAASRPDLMADIAVAQSELHLKEKRPQQALAMYGQVLEHYATAGPIVMRVMERVEVLLIENRELDRLTAIYEHIWTRLPTPEASAYVRTTPYYILGERYLQLLQRTDATAARTVQSRLDSLTASSTATSGRR